MTGDGGRTAIYLDPALSERIIASRHGRYLEEPDSMAQRRENLLREIGYDIINRRLQSLTRRPNAPFRAANLGTGEVFRAGRTTSLTVDTIDGKWQRGLTAAALEYRRALEYGFTKTEVAEQVAIIRTAHRNAVGASATRSNAALVHAALTLVRDDEVPATPQSSLARLEAFVPQITPDAVRAALTREAVPLDNPLLRFSGRNDPVGGVEAIRAAWDAAMKDKIAPTHGGTAANFAYSSFGQPGTLVSDVREAALGIRQVRFANGVRLNLKQTTLEQDRVLVQVSVDGGDMLATSANPLATEMVSTLAAGGLGKHSQDELQTILAGRTVGMDLSSTPETFTALAQTTPGDVELQLQLMAAYITDPGYRPEGEALYRQTINNFFAQKDATPVSALVNALGGILSDNDPRFSLQKQGDYRALTFAKLREDLAERLSRGAIEIGIVGDLPEEQAIALVASVKRTSAPMTISEAARSPPTGRSGPSITAAPPTRQ